MATNNHYRTDILQTSNDLYVNKYTNDFDLGPSDIQHVNDILLSCPGWWKAYPTLGVNTISYLKSKAVSQKLIQSIQLQITSDGYKLQGNYTFTNNILDIVNFINLK